MLNENTRQLISQTILINYVFNCRIVQIEAISVSYLKLVVGNVCVYTGWRRINRTIYFCRPSCVFLQQNT